MEPLTAALSIRIPGGRDLRLDHLVLLLTADLVPPAIAVALGLLRDPLSLTATPRP